MLNNLRKNCMGTTTFDGKFAGMRKAQDFDVYPIGKDGEAERLTIQSDTRIGYVELKTGHVLLCPPKSGGAYNHDLAFVRHIDTLTAEELFMLKAQVFGTASGKAGTSGVYCDNAGATNIFSGS